ncbi:MAG: 2-amino-4-hydroxy-6-hydroxymethyldihydropteridine diphosphokinase [Candidatus Pelagibacter sp.]
MIKDKRLKEEIGIEIEQDISENHHEPVYLGIGSNLGNRVNNINNACYLLRTFCLIDKISNFYETNSWPNKKHPKFLNIILKCYTKLNVISLLKTIKTIEKKLGRKKTLKNFPRSCDIDIIDFKGIKLDKKNIKIPHPRLSDRNFVLVPLYEIEKTWKHPKNNISIENLLKNLNFKSLRGIKIF